jgi:phosphoglycerol transferase MdoB-like AlkP superfamily enzyme
MVLAGYTYLDRKINLGDSIMDTYNVILAIQILSIMLVFGLPYIARQIWLTTDKIAFILFIVLFWLICSFVAIVSVYTWTAGFAS